MDLDANFEVETPPPSTATILVDIKSLRELDVQGELLTQYTTAKRLFSAAEHDEGVPLNQKAQTLNVISTILSTITKAQTELYDSERLKTLEAILLDVLQEFPALSTEFMRRYEERLNVQ